MALAALIVGLVAVVVSVVAAIASVQSARAAERSATAAESSDRQSRRPVLAFFLEQPSPAPNDRVIYRVRNDGPQDLVSLVIYRPKPPDGITYPIAMTGRDFGADEIEVGPLPIAGQARFTLCCGAGEDLPEFQVRVECRAGSDCWETSQVLSPPRGTPRPIPTEEIRAAVDAIRGPFQDIVVNGGERAPFFLTESRKGVALRVRDLTERVDDAPLRQRLIWVADRWDSAFGHAPPEQGARAFRPGSPYPPEYKREDDEARTRLAQVSSEAGRGLRECAEVLRRLNELERARAIRI